MAAFHQPVGLGPRDGSRVQRVIALVGTGHMYSVMPSPLLRMLGIDPEWTEVFTTASGSQEEYSLAEVRIRIDVRERTTICVFGKPDSQPVLGTHTLDGFGLAVDEVNNKLVRAKLSLE